MKFVFEPSGEPPVGEDQQRPEAYETDQHWKNENRERWQLHSEKGPNVEPEAKNLPPPKPFEHLVQSRETTCRARVRAALDEKQLRLEPCKGRQGETSF